MQQKNLLQEAHYGHTVVNIMKDALKKVPKNFRIDAKLEAELRDRSKISGISETRILEFALENYFNGAMQIGIQKLAEQLGKREATTLTR